MSYSVPTAEFAVDLRVPIAGHDNEWEWRRCQEQPLSLEFIYSHSELCRAVQIYAPVAAKTIPAGRYEGFRIVVHGAITGRLLATYEWRWEPYADRYVPAGPPWCSWPPKSILPDAVRRGQARYSPRPFVPAPMCGSPAPCELLQMRDRVKQPAAAAS